MAANDHIRQLFVKYIDETITEQEYSQLLDFFSIDKNDTDAAQLLYDAIASENLNHSVSEERLQSITHSARQRLERRIQVSKKRSLMILWPYAAAAALFIMAGYWVIMQVNTDKSMIQHQLVSKFGDDVPPGSNRATVTLPDGSEIPLEEQQTGVIADGKGRLSYINGEAVTAGHRTGDLTIKTPNGGQYFLILPDSTKVWLNSASAITYPSIFTGDHREISIKGEVYLEIKNDKAKPFIVYSKRQRIEILGTALNLKSYEDEPSTVTTLISGRIRVSDAGTGQTKILDPGQQATSSVYGLEIENIPQDRLPAWKDGLLVLRDAEFTEVRRELERWYNVEFIGTPQNSTAVTAILSRNGNLSDVLESMESYTGLKFKIEGRTVMVE